MNQEKIPFYEALEKYVGERFIPFHTPGHKIGKGAHPKLQELMGASLPYDLGIMYALDDLHEPDGCIKEAQELAAKLYGAEETWFSINGTTALIETMIMATVAEGDEIFIPREAHRSVISGLVLSGAKPIYMESNVDSYWGVTQGVTPEQFSNYLRAYPKAKAVLFIYPNYYGIGVQLETLVKMAHDAGLVVLVDEAHGAHLPFSEELPISALEAGADLVAQSTHKLVGSLTQTSMLHGQGNRFSKRRVTQVHQMLQSTSPNYILLASLDIARQQLAMQGKSLVGEAVLLAKKLRCQLEKLEGILVYKGEAHFDCTKVLIDFRQLGISGKDAEKFLRGEHIEVELVNGYHVLVLITMGDTKESIDLLVQVITKLVAVCDKKNYGHKKDNKVLLSLPNPVVRCTPRQAYGQTSLIVPLSEALGCVAGETITYYPPGIPCVALGEEITEEVIAFLENRRENGYIPNGAKDVTLQTIRVLEMKEYKHGKINHY